MLFDQTNQEKIGYIFKSGVDVERIFYIIDKTGVRREFLIHINDEEGITSCTLVKKS